VSSASFFKNLSLKLGASVHTLAQAKLDLAEEEAAQKKTRAIARHEMSPSNFILAVFDIEERLYVFVPLQ
jgi:hypothetical protein